VETAGRGGIVIGGQGGMVMGGSAVSASWGWLFVSLVSLFMMGRIDGIFEMNYEVVSNDNNNNAPSLSQRNLN
jgi:hypothetical protein